MSALKKILDAAKTYCDDNGHRLTQPRLDVLTIIATAKKPIGAYEILEEMGGNTKPPTVYRALEFWEEEGFVHRIGSTARYTICSAGHRHSGAQFLICDSCGDIEEAHICAMPQEISSKAQDKSFSVTGWILELHGLCKKCAKLSKTPASSCV